MGNCGNCLETLTVSFSTVTETPLPVSHNKSLMSVNITHVISKEEKPSNQGYFVVSELVFKNKSGRNMGMSLLQDFLSGKVNMPDRDES